MRRPGRPLPLQLVVACLLARLPGMRELEPVFACLRAMWDLELVVARSPAVRELEHLIAQAAALCVLELAASCCVRQLAAPRLRLSLELAASPSLRILLLLAIDAERRSFSEMSG
jgi:hypothetical protein